MGEEEERKRDWVLTFVVVVIDIKIDEIVNLKKPVNILKVNLRNNFV